MISESSPAPLLAVTATFTAEAIRDALSFWIKELDWNYEIRFAPYNQVFQQLLDPASLLRANRKGVNIVLVRLEDWVRFGTSPVPDLPGIERHAAELAAALRSTAECFLSPLLVCVCPASPAFLDNPAHVGLHQALERRLATGLAGLNNVHLLPVSELDELYPVAQVHDAHADELGHVPYTPEFFAALATFIVRKMHALGMPSYKLIAVDCDNTLWKGICGEDGPQGVVLDPGRRALQEFLVAQHDAGMLLAMASKNNADDVLDTFRLNPRMPLRLDHFVSWRIDWQPKAVNLSEMARELDLDLSSFILIDDNPKECAEMEANHPEVLALALPGDAARIPPFLRHVWAFDHLRVTEEDRRRSMFYARQVERGRAQRQAGSLAEFLESLQLDVRIAPMAAEELARVAQLTGRTSQMNFTTVRRTESEIQALGRSGAAEVMTVHVSDRFGSYGLAGVMIFRVAAGALVVDTFLLSCRALGRGVEHRMLAALGTIAHERDAAVVEVPFVRTARNIPALLFLESVGLEFQQAEAGSLCFRFPAGRAAGLRYKPGAATAMPGLEPAPPPAAARPARIPYARIASELREPARILARIQSHGSARSGNRAYAAPRTELERRLAEIWAESLRVSPVGIHDDFFDLGGHSLLAVQLMSRVRQEFGVDLSLELVYSGSFNVAELAEAIEVKEIQSTGADQYAAMLEELEALSDEEARALLAEEGDPSCESS